MNAANAGRTMLPLGFSSISMWFSRAGVGVVVSSCHSSKSKLTDWIKTQSDLGHAQRPYHCGCTAGFLVVEFVILSWPLPWKLGVLDFKGNKCSSGGEILSGQCANPDWQLVIHVPV